MVRADQEDAPASRSRTAWPLIEKGGLLDGIRTDDPDHGAPSPRSGEPRFRHAQLSGRFIDPGKQSRRDVSPDLGRRQEQDRRTQYCTAVYRQVANNPGTFADNPGRSPGLFSANSGRRTCLFRRHDRLCLQAATTSDAGRRPPGGKAASRRLGRVGQRGPTLSRRRLVRACGCNCRGG